jgi:hypothetical protein
MFGPREIWQPWSLMREKNFVRKSSPLEEKTKYFILFLLFYWLLSSIQAALHML